MEEKKKKEEIITYQAKEQNGLTSGIRSLLNQEGGISTKERKKTRPLYDFKTQVSYGR